jgi:hypothetical protein
MTAALIPPVIPRAAPPADHVSLAGPARILPLAAVSEPLPALAADVVYGLGRIDASGRIAERAVSTALSWRNGERLALTAAAGVVTAAMTRTACSPCRPGTASPSRRPYGTAAAAPGRPGPARRAPGRGHAHRLLPRGGRSGHPHARDVPSIWRKAMTITAPAPDPDPRQPSPSKAEVDAALLLLERLGLSPSDLIEAPRPRPAVPTFADYIPVISALVSDGCRKAYGSYWNRVIDQ